MSRSRKLGRRRPTSRGLQAAIVFLVLACAIPTAAEGVATKRMSDERTSTLVAYVTGRTQVREKPSWSARPVAPLRQTTFSGYPEVVIVLERTVGGKWSLVRFAGLGRRVGWVRTSALDDRWRVNTRLVIDRRRHRLRLYRRGRVIVTASVGVGASQSPTPGGRFYVRERLRPPSSDSIYGALAFGLSAFSRYRTDWPGGGQVGVHGTNQPELIPGRISNGCVRLRNERILKLGRRMPLGTPVLIR